MPVSETEKDTDHAELENLRVRKQYIHVQYERLFTPRAHYYYTSTRFTPYIEGVFGIIYVPVQYMQDQLRITRRGRNSRWYIYKVHMIVKTIDLAL